MKAHRWLPWALCSGGLAVTAGAAAPSSRRPVQFTPEDLSVGMQALPAGAEASKHFLSEIAGQLVVEAVKDIPYPSGQPYVILQNGQLLKDKGELKSGEPFCILHRDLTASTWPAQTRLGLALPSGGPKDPYALKDFIFPIETNSVGLREWQCLRQDKAGWRLLTLAEFRTTLGTGHFRLQGWRPAPLAQAR
jgi:hypothetical protein